MPVSVFSTDSRPVAIPAAYLTTPKLRDAMPGNTLTGKNRAAYLADLGCTDDSVPNSLLRHLLPKGINRKVVADIRAAYGDEAADIAVEFKQCPALVEFGISPADSYNSQVSNGIRNSAGVTLRTSTIPCPHCLGAALAADLKRGAIADKQYAAVIGKGAANSDTE